MAKIRRVHFLEITFFRMLVQTVYITPCVYFQRQSFCGAREDRLKLVLRGLFGTLSMGGMYFAVQNMPLAEASVIHFSSPAFVGIMAFVLLRESCGVFEILVTMATFTGVVLIAQPAFLFDTSAASTTMATITTPNAIRTEFDEMNMTLTFTGMTLNATDVNYTLPTDSIQTLEGSTVTIMGDGTRLIGSFSALVASVAGACVHITLRQLKHVDVATVIFTYSILGTVCSAAGTFIAGKWTCPADYITWLQLLGVGTFAVLAQLCFTAALREENAGTVSVLRTTEILFAFCWQTTLLGLYPNAFSIIGACMITTCALAHGVRKWRKVEQETQTLPTQLVNSDDDEDEVSSEARNRR